MNENYTNPIYYENRSMCQNACKLNPNCVQFIFFNENYTNSLTTVLKNSCFLRDSIDWANGINIRPEAEAWSISSAFNFNNMIKIYLQRVS
jgi:hypothetical protein